MAKDDGVEAFRLRIQRLIYCLNGAAEFRQSAEVAVRGRDAAQGHFGPRRGDLVQIARQQGHVFRVRLGVDEALPIDPHGPAP